jgi:hypothetical protein
MAENFNVSPFTQPPYWQVPPWWTGYPPPYNPQPWQPPVSTRGGGQQQQVFPSDFSFGNFQGGFQPQGPQGTQQGVPGMQQGVPGMQQGVPGMLQGQQGMQQGMQQGQQGMQQGVGGLQQGMQQTSMPLSEADKVALRPVLAILKEGRALIASGQLVGLNAHRILAAYAYLAGFLEARGLVEVGAFPRTIPQPVAFGGTVGNEQYDRLIMSLDSLVSGTETRVPPVVIAIGASVAGAAIWDGIKWAYNKATS